METDLSNGTKINRATEHASQFLLHSEELEVAGNFSRLEFDENIHVAIGPEIVSQNRAEKRELADVIPPAKGIHEPRWKLYALFEHKI